MNSFESYKDQCYNIGSPSPNPIRSSPLTLSGSKKVQAEFSFTSSPENSITKTRPVRSKVKAPPNKSKIPSLLSTSRKRFSESSELVENTPKKPKMEELRAMLEKQNKDQQDFMGKMTSRMDNLYTKLDSIKTDNTNTTTLVQNHMTKVESRIDNLQSSVDDNRIKFEDKLVQLEGQFNKFQENALNQLTTSKEDIRDAVTPIIDEIVPKIKEDIKNDIISPVKATWNAILSEQVKEHEHALIVFGLKIAGNPIEAAGDFLKKDLKVDEETMLRISIKQAYKLGKGDGIKNPPLLIKFGHPSERNTVLSHSKNLAGTKIKVEKHIPKSYQEKHKEFKKMSWKLKTMPEINYMTQIIFDNHVMVLRVRKKDSAGEKFHWVNHASYVPPMDTKETEKSSLKTPVGTKATPPPDKTSMDRANTALFMPMKGMTDVFTSDTFKNKLLEHLNPNHKGLIADVQMTNKPELTIVYCDSWNSANIISESYKSKFKFNGYDTSFEQFAQNNPDSSD